MRHPAVFRKLSKLRSYQKEALPFLVTTVDLDIVLTIGLAHESGEPIGTMTLFSKGFAPTATISRRLRRLKRAGAVTEKRSPSDARRIELRLSPAVSRNLHRLLQHA